LEITNEANIPDVIVKAIEGDPYSRGESDISVTELIAPPRIISLRRKHKDQISVEAIDLVWSLYGRVMHNILEQAGESVQDVITEERLFTEQNGWTVSGSFDALAMSSKGKDAYAITDYKFVTAWRFVDGMPEEMIQQLNLYAELLRRHGYEVRELFLVALYRDWSKNRAKGNSSYPQKAVEVHEVPLWDQKRTTAFMEKRIGMHKQAQESLPKCTRKERWTNPPQPQWALMKDGRKSAIKLYNDADEAERAKTSNDNYVVFRAGTDVRCENYCDVAQFCSQYQNTKEKN